MKFVNSMVKNFLLLILCLTFCQLSCAGNDLKESLTAKAKTGDIEAQFELGNRLLKGWGMAFSPKEALNWLKQRARLLPDFYEVEFTVS